MDSTLASWHAADMRWWPFGTGSLPAAWDITRGFMILYSSFRIGYITGMWHLDSYYCRSLCKGWIKGRGSQTPIFMMNILLYSFVVINTSTCLWLHASISESLSFLYLHRAHHTYRRTPFIVYLPSLADFSGINGSLRFCIDYRWLNKKRSRTGIHLCYQRSYSTGWGAQKCSAKSISGQGIGRCR